MFFFAVYHWVCFVNSGLGTSRSLLVARYFSIFIRKHLPKFFFAL